MTPAGWSPRSRSTTLVDTTTGLRPGSPDNAPIVGATDVPGLVMATGHYRNGILLAPVTADEVVRLLLGGGDAGAADRRRPFAAVRPGPLRPGHRPEPGRRRRTGERWPRTGR